MAGIFKNNAAQQPGSSPRQALEARYNGARNNLLLVVLFTVVNVVLLVTNSNTYFLFSASIPYILANFGMAFGGFYPEEYYEGLGELQFLGAPFLTVALVIAALIVVLYLLSWIFSKKGRVGWLIFALVFFALDTAVMLLFTEISSEIIVDIVFHAWVLFSLGSGIYAHVKLKQLPAEEEVAPNAGWEAPAEQAVAEPAAEEAPVEEATVAPETTTAE